ncbi:MAG TPA: ATP-binding protein [bacterium]
MYLTFFCIWILLAVLAHRRVWIAQQNCSGEEKKRLQLVFWGMLAGFGGGGSTILPAFGVMLPPLGGFLIPIHSVIVAYAIVRHQLLDIVVVVRKSLLYSLLVGLISCTYLIAVLVLERTFQGMLGYETLFSSLIVAFIIAFFFNPVRDRIQHFIDRALFKGTAYELAAQRDQLLFEIRRGDQMKAVATLAAGLAHEIKNPLSSIRTFTEYLEANHADHEFRAKFRKIVGGEVDRINRIVQELLEFAKPQPPKLEPVELSKALDETLELLNNELVKRHVEVQKDYAAPAMVLGDRQKLQQVFLNLVLNSLDAMNGAGRVVASLSLSGPEAVLAIRDNGQGIPREQIGKVFDPFFSTKPHGTGLGLSVVRSIIAEHGGKIAMESAGRQGVTVTIRLPLATDSRLPMRLKKETT